MLDLADYHMHTKRCGHARGEMEQYVEEAIRKGLAEIGFSDHLPLVTHRDPGLTMGEEELPRYVEDVLQVREKYPEIAIKLGIEADFVLGYEEKTRRLLEPYDWDYIIGSVHIIDQWEFDDPRHLETWDDKDIDAVYHRYYELLRASAESGLCDIVAHCDLVKKFGHRPQADLRAEFEETAETFQRCGVAVEINTSGWYKPVAEVYPAFPILQILQRYDLPLVISSDAHAPQEVGRDFDRAIEQAQKAGYAETVIFSGREIVERRPLPDPVECQS